MLQVKSVQSIANLGFTAADPANANRNILRLDDTAASEVTDLGLNNVSDILVSYGKTVPAISVSSIQINVFDTYSLPPVPFPIRLGTENLLVTAVDHGLKNITVTRAVYGSQPQAHPYGERTANGTIVSVDHAEQLPTSLPFVARIGDERVVVTSVDVLHNTITIERASMRGLPLAHFSGETLL